MAPPLGELARARLRGRRCGEGFFAHFAQKGGKYFSLPLPPCGNGGLFCIKSHLRRASGELIDILLAKVPANTPEGKAELSEALNHHAFNLSACTRIGIAVVTIDGQMYWTCSVYY